MFSAPKPARPIPVDGGVFPRDVLSVLKEYVVENPATRRQHRELSSLFEQAFLAKWRGGSEYNQVSFWDKLVRAPLEFLFDCSDTIKLTINRNVSDQSGAVKKSSRPDFLGWLEGFLVFIGEEKDVAGGFMAALNDLKTKSEPDTLGEARVPKIFAYAAGGSEIKFFIIDRVNGVLPLSRSFDLMDGVKRVRIVATVFQIFRCLQYFPSRLPRGAQRLAVKFYFF